jgi:AcrR family transcriptional regulator
MRVNDATERRGSPRERLLSAADELFYQEGVNTVGIDRVIERAGVAKASLYDCFGSKEGLIRSYLEARAQRRRVRLTDHVSRHCDPRERLLAVFDALDEALHEPNNRGCAFVRASAEARSGAGAREVCDESRGWMLEFCRSLAADAGARDPAALSRQMVLLYDGAAVAAQMDADHDAAQVARAAAAVLLDASLP